MHARDDRFAALYGLAQRVQHMRREFRELVEKKHAMVGERDFARFGPRASADKRRHACGMMGRAERPVRGQRPVQDRARDALDHGHFKQFSRLQRRQYARKPLGEHGFAGAGRPDHQHVMAAGRRDLQRSLGAFLAPHVLEIGGGLPALIEMRRGCGRCAFPFK